MLSVGCVLLVVCMLCVVACCLHVVCCVSVRWFGLRCSLVVACLSRASPVRVAPCLMNVTCCKLLVCL